MGGLTLPRIRVRSRRRKPRGPQWRRKARRCALVAITAIVLSLVSAPYSAIGCSIALGVEWRELHHAPYDPEAPPLTLRQSAENAVATAVALGFMLVGIVS